MDILSIVIPTYNRREILQYNLNYILDEIIEFDIPIYISDDSPNDETKVMVENIRKRYSRIFYSKNEPRLGHDKNCIATLKMPNAEYVWYLGDSMIIKKGSIKKILSIIHRHSPDFISFKEQNRRIDIPSGLISKADTIFNDLAWHLTMSGTTIYKKNKIKFENFNLNKFKNFPQLALIFVSFDDNQSKFFWLNESLICGNVNKKSYWSANVFEVFFKDLENTLTNLPQKYNTKDISKIVKKHNVQSQLFSYSNMIHFRMAGAYNYRVWRKYFNRFYTQTDCNIFFLFLLSITSQKILKKLYILFRKIKPKNLNDTKIST
ncbi:glycosyltransferase family 2 protein [Chryseobacterium sp. SC28]|uniref:glycosyltransferase family 2 protein n=1 Tax=Chryseobacterium sp. SC28 TaxID=2268028 RepID=UPI000F646BF2|nr:glycosyltransferase family 2 protein [Chryseobacterium sp. SC28]RRQ45332.1 glycosyltransferase [Chryseobacterium sp. SC28]